MIFPLQATAKVLGRGCYSLCILLLPLATAAQINDFVPEKSFYDFAIRSEKKTTGQRVLLHVMISKNGQIIIHDSVETNTKICAGFSVPDVQPFEEYFIFSKHEKGNGKTFILSKTGEYSVISGGTFWAAPKHQLLFLLAERDLTNLVIYSLKEKKILIEKFNCDEFYGWYFKQGAFIGSVVMECGVEPEKEKEITEWMRPVVVEKYEPAKNNLYESHITESDLRNAKALTRYASCNP